MRFHQLLFATLIVLFFLSATGSNLQFKESGEFTILQLTDLHFCHQTKIKSYTPEKIDNNDRKTQALQRMLISMSKPDLVVFSGDAITALYSVNPFTALFGESKKSTLYQFKKEKRKIFDITESAPKRALKGERVKGDFERCWEKVSKAVYDANIPYAYILGNHDAEGPLTREQVMKLDIAQPLSIRKGLEGIPNTCNFVSPIYSSKNKEKVAANIWFFDSGMKSCDSFGGNTWGCVEQNAIDWYNYQSKKLKEKQSPNVHHLSFIHIPLPEFADLANNGEYYGNRNEDVHCPYVNTRLFDHIQRNKDITGIYSGHDHKNNMGGWHEGVELVYGQKGGYATYGDERGARVITLKENYNEKGELTVSRRSHIIFENGTLSHDQTVRREQDGRVTSCPYLGKDLIKGAKDKTVWNFNRRFIKRIVE